MTEATSLIAQCLRKPGLVSQLMLDDLQRACVALGCQTLFQLQRMLRLCTPTTLKPRVVELLMSRLDAVGLDVTGVPWETDVPQQLLISEAVWSYLWGSRNRAEPLIDNSGIRACLRAIGKLAASGIWFAAQLSTGQGSWMTWQSIAVQGVAESVYMRLLDILSASPDLERITKERTTIPGLRQLHLWEAVGHNSESGEAGPDNDGEGRRRDKSLASSRSDPLATARQGLLRRHPWQHSPPLPDNVTFDLTSDAPVLLAAPPGWELLERNGRLLIRAPSGTTCQLEAAQAAMLELMNQGLDQAAFLSALVSACNAQQCQDDVRTVHWSRHFLACIARITGARGLVGCRPVTFHPHYWWFSSPDQCGEPLGSQCDWPAEDCVLLLDAYQPTEREEVLRRAFGHAAQVWILRLAEPGEASTRDHKSLVSLRTQLVARLPKGSLVVHPRECWSEAKFDARPSTHVVEIWRTGRADTRRALLGPADFGQALGDWEHRREDFHWPADEHPMAWDFYRANQQDAAQSDWPLDGLVAAIDGSVERKTESMGAGVVGGIGRIPEIGFSFAVGGPLASLRAEAAALLSLLEAVEPDRPLLIFSDCLVLLGILSRWGQVDFWPDPEDVKHFDIIEQSIQRLRSRVGHTRLIKVKSHSGLLMNDRADALAEQGRSSEGEPRWQAPRKLDPLGLSARTDIREAHAPFPDHNVADKILIRRAVEGATLLAARMKDTTFSREMLLHPKNCGPVLAAVTSMPDSMARVWMQAVTGQYPTATRLHKWFPERYPTPNCSWCQHASVDGAQGVPETLSHFLTVCPRFREARTEAHNACWRAIMRDIDRVVAPEWQFFYDRPMRDTGLLTGPTGSAQAGRALDEQAAAAEPQALPEPGDGEQPADLRNLRPDAVAVNSRLKTIVILEHCRPFDGTDRESAVDPTNPLDPLLAATSGRAAPPERSEPETQDEPHPSHPDDQNGRGEAGGPWVRPPAPNRILCRSRQSRNESGEASTDGHAEAAGQENSDIPQSEYLASAGPAAGRGSITTARLRKLEKYQPLAEALAQRHGSSGWKVHVLPWVVGVRGVVDAEGIQRAMAILEVPPGKRQGLLRKSAVASVESLVNMHRVRISGVTRVRTDREGGSSLEPPAASRKRRRAEGDAGQTMERWKRLVTDPMRRNFQYQTASYEGRRI